MNPMPNTDHRDRIELILSLAAVALVGLLIILVFGMVFLKVTPDATEIGLLMAVITPVVGLAIGVYGYFMGSSKSSQTANATIAEQIATPPVVVTADPTQPGPAKTLVIRPEKVPP